MRAFRIAMVQMNPVVGDVDGNVRAMGKWVTQARRVGADIVVFPELAVTGYPPEDLVLRPSFLRDTTHALQWLTKQCRDLTVVAGYLEEGRVIRLRDSTPFVVPSGPRHVFNAAAVIHDRRVVATCQKTFLPNYGVFDESRYFSPGKQALVCQVQGMRFGVNICEDIWYAGGPTRDQVSVGGARLILNINASPYHVGKARTRERMLAQRARENDVVVSYTNMVGGQDEVVFDGNSLIVDRTGTVITRAGAFEEELLVADLSFDRPRETNPVGREKRAGQRYPVKRVRLASVVRRKPNKPVPLKNPPVPHDVEEIYQALVTGVRDYVRKNRFQRVLIAVSGGIDSALTAVIAVDALGPDRVTGVFMPSPFTSRESRVDANALMKVLNVRLLTIPITRLWKQYVRTLSSTFGERAPDVTEENLQARIRGTIVMALSNKFGHLVLTTGNKSEISVGYATLYGDMAGGFAVIKDVSKILVYDLARYRNRKAVDAHGAAVIPQRIIDRAPSAELKPDQTDQDALPPYEVLDPILEAYVEKERSLQEIAGQGFPLQTVKRVMTLVDRSEYKRRQAPVGIKITQKALGKDRRMPITNRYVKR
ncbi:MAG: NAD+ synthase [Nitrospira sp.]|nr:NAD+ synthase [Nitrospira sp.]